LPRKVGFELIAKRSQVLVIDHVERGSKSQPVDVLENHLVTLRRKEITNVNFFNGSVRCVYAHDNLYLRRRFSAIEVASLQLYR
jgi:hypothetical protein